MKKTTRKRPVAHTRTVRSGKKIIVNPDIRRSTGRRKQHIVSFSGGKDSSAMLLRMIELKMPIDRIIFAETDHEFPQIYKYIKRMNAYTTRKIGVPVEVVSKKSAYHRHRADSRTWDDWFYGKLESSKYPERIGKRRGFPLTISFCWWSRESKVKVLDPICEGNYRYIGFGVDESKRVKAGRDKPGWRFPLDKWGWTEEDCRQYLIRRGWAEQIHIDFNRTGCYLCPKQGENSLRVMCKKYPTQWDKTMKYVKSCQTNEFMSKKFNIKNDLKRMKQIEREERPQSGMSYWNEVK